ncbi:hypothetical protein LDL36_11880 [Komagataeibacter sp. FNDCR1]|nr:hypothetical protein [Komagataeibacter sp. FNDCR1]
MTDACNPHDARASSHKKPWVVTENSEINPLLNKGSFWVLPFLKKGGVLFTGCFLRALP